LIAQDGKGKIWCCSLLKKRKPMIFHPFKLHSCHLLFQSRCRYDIHKLQDKSNLQCCTRVEKGMSRHHSCSCYTCYRVSLSHQQFSEY
jgi:hypothetical protein